MGGRATRESAPPPLLLRSAERSPLSRQPLRILDAGSLSLAVHAVAARLSPGHRVGLGSLHRRSASVAASASLAGRNTTSCWWLSSAAASLGSRCRTAFGWGGELRDSRARPSWTGAHGEHLQGGRRSPSMGGERSLRFRYRFHIYLGSLRSRREAVFDRARIHRIHRMLCLAARPKRLNDPGPMPTPVHVGRGALAVAEWCPAPAVRPAR